jgi:transposase
MIHNEFLEWLFSSKPTRIIFEACGMSNYWKQKAVEAGHQCELISAKLVSTVRQNQKTDKNDALAIVQAAMLPDVNFIQGKNIEQQQLQSMLHLRELAIKQKTALSNQIKALLLEFNIRISGKGGCVTAAIQAFIEDAENQLTFEFRKALSTACAQYQSLVESIKVYDMSLDKTANEHDDCKRLLKLEGVSTVNAVNLYIALGCAELDSFSKGKDASARIGLTPLQYSSGGKTKIGAIGKYVKNGVL